jgi:hypothetical protein
VGSVLFGSCADLLGTFASIAVCELTVGTVARLATKGNLASLLDYYASVIEDKKKIDVQAS